MIPRTPTTVVMTLHPLDLHLRHHLLTDHLPVPLQVHIRVNQLRVTHTLLDQLPMLPVTRVQVEGRLVQILFNSLQTSFYHHDLFRMKLSHLSF